MNMQATKNTLDFLSFDLYRAVSQPDTTMRKVLTAVGTKEDCLTVLNGAIQYMDKAVSIAERREDAALTDLNKVKGNKSSKSNDKRTIECANAYALAQAELVTVKADMEAAKKRLYQTLKQSIQRTKPHFLGKAETFGMVKGQFVIRATATKAITTDTTTETMPEKMPEKIESGKTISQGEYDSLALRLDKAIKEGEKDKADARSALEREQIALKKAKELQAALDNALLALDEAKRKNNALLARIADFERGAAMKVA